MDKLNPSFEIPSHQSERVKREITEVVTKHEGRGLTWNEGEAQAQAQDREQQGQGGGRTSGR